MTKYLKFDEKNDQGWTKYKIYERVFNGEETVFNVIWESEFTDNYTANKLANEKLDELYGIVRPKKVVEPYEEIEIHPYHEWYDGSRFKYNHCLQ